MSYYTSQYLDEAFVRQVAFRHNKAEGEDRFNITVQAAKWLAIDVTAVQSEWEAERAPFHNVFEAMDELVHNGYPDLYDEDLDSIPF